MTQSKPTAALSWLATSDAVLRGLNHEFSNRLSLARLAPQLAAMIAAGEQQMRALAEDVDGAEEMFRLLRLYRLLVFETSDPAEPALVTDALADAIALFKHHVEFRDLEVQVGEAGSLPPVLMNPSALVQSVLLLLCAAARCMAVRPGEPAKIAVRFSADADAVHVTAASADAAGSKDSAEPPEFPALRYLVRDALGTVTANGGTVTLSLGTLVRLRRLAKQG
jgi:nitrogen-specific signal transduction histidine kinase